MDPPRPPDADTGNIKVAVRVRPFGKSDLDDGAASVVSIDRERKCVCIRNPSNGERKTFTFDYVYDSFVGPDSPSHASQETLWNDLGGELLSAAWEGYNYSLFAYGQTGSGKSHSMLGFGRENDKKGLLPRACEAMFDRIAESESRGAADGAEDVSFKVEATMVEIYNEKIRDLFVPARQQKHGGLRVRDLPKTGAYVEGIKKMPVSSSKQIKNLIEFGTRNRTVAATNMNETSSRAHTIFTISLVQTTVDRSTMKASNKTSCINLVDLAGSERIGKTGAEGDRLKEGGHINKSLSALGNVINALADKAKGKKAGVIPYRDSLLTHLLKSSLGGNAKTTMIAAVSPADTNFSESLSTLRYADRAKRIRNAAVVNEDPNDRLIRSLREEMERLRSRLKGKDEIEAAFRRELERKRAEWERHRREAEAALRSEVEDDGGVDRISSDLPFLSNLNEDLALSDKLRFHLEKNAPRTVTSLHGSDEDDQSSVIRLGGLGVVPNHAMLEHRVDDDGESRIFLGTLQSGSRTLVNGTPVTPGVLVKLYHCDRVIFGQSCVFKVVIPADLSRDGADDSFDWEYAMKEANAAVMGKLEAENREHIEAAERVKRDMEKKVRDLEEQLRLERERLSEEGATKEEMLQKQRELEERLAHQIGENEKFTRQHEQERKERSIIDRQLLHTLPLVHEANSISLALQKGLTFKAKLTSKTNNEYFSDGTDVFSTEISIVAFNANTSRPPNLWTLDKFNARIYVMRELYQTWVENNQSLEGTEFEDEGSCPFHDPPEDMLIGVARIQLEALKYVLDIHEHTPIVDYSGRSHGELEVITVPSLLEKYGEVDDLEEVIDANLAITIQVQGARGLDLDVVNAFQSLYVAYQFLGPDQTESGKVPLVNINPAIGFKTEVGARVTARLASYFSHAALCIEVWASVEEPEAANHSSTEKQGRKNREMETQVALLTKENERLQQKNDELESRLSQALEQIAVLTGTADAKG